MNAEASRSKSDFEHSGTWVTNVSNHMGYTFVDLLRITQGSLIDVEYRFSATANDGKILSQKNWLSGEDVTYLRNFLSLITVFPDRDHRFCFR